MAQKENQNTSLTVMDYLDNQTAALEALIPTGIKGKRNTTLIYVAALLVAFGISYGIGSVMHSATVKANADPDKTISVSDANSLMRTHINTISSPILAMISAFPRMAVMYCLSMDIPSFRILMALH